MANTYSIKQSNINLPTNYANGTVTAAWATPNTNFVSSNSTPIMTIPHGEDTVRIEESATLDVIGKVRINGEFLDERLERIETLLQIPVRDVKMEEKYPKLKEIWAEYNRELAKYRTWDGIKGDE